MRAPDWTFAPQFNPARRARLERFSSFDEVVQAILPNISNIAYAAARETVKGIPDCVRPIFTLSVGTEVVDAFYNSPSGYRAQFLISPEQGLAADRYLITCLNVRLMKAAATLNSPNDLVEAQMRKSLAHESAKVWIAETVVPDLNLPRDLLVPAWVVTATLGGERAEKGLRALSCGEVEVKGAWLGSFDQPVVTKPDRHFELHTCGYT